MGERDEVCLYNTLPFLKKPRVAGDAKHKYVVRSTDCFAISRSKESISNFES